MEISTHRRRKNFLLVFQKHNMPLITVLLTVSVHCALFQVVSAVSNPNIPRFSPLIPPPQVLLPPHREEGQSLDDIIYGTSFSGSALSNFPFLKNSPVNVPRPNLASTSPPTPSFPSSPPFRNNNNNVINAPLPPSPTPQHQRTFSHSHNNVNLVQTFTPPSPPPPPQSNPLFPLPSSRPIAISSSAEEIKVPQSVKHRTPQRKQYTKADLIAAANSIKPAGFDFSKVLIVTPSNNNLNASSGNGNDPRSLYNQVMFPLPLFDTPVYNQLRPLMEMLIKAKFDLGGGSVSDNRKVLVIIPKANGSSGGQTSARNANGANKNPLLSNSKSPLKHQLQSSATTTSSSKSSPTSKFSTLPKFSAAKHATTIKPKPSSQGFSTTTKRASKLVAFTSPVGNVKVTGRKSDKGPDLQAAATSNKLSQRPGANSPASATSSEKRSYSSKGDDNYSFSYAVKNDAYKDVKSHSESRDGDSVAGEYSMLEADGYTRVVRYTVDSDQGFKASVKRIPPS